MPRVAKKSSPQKVSSRKKGKKKICGARKVKKAVRSNILPAVLLTASLIAVSVIVSIAVIGIGRGKSQAVELSHISTALPERAFQEIVLQEAAFFEAAENPPVQDIVPVEKLSEKTPETQQSPKIMPPLAPLETLTLPETMTPLETLTPLKAVPEQPPQRGTLVFVIDDAGNNLQELEPFLHFPGPLTIAVLPGLTHSAEAARRIRAAGKEVFLHQPMEALGGQDPGPGAIYTGMNAAEVLAILKQNIAEIGPIAGMNNHQGSKITMDKQIMETVLAFCHEQGISFLDSRTTAETSAPAAAQNLGIKIGERNVFIDNEQDRPSMDRSIKSGLALAVQKGSSVMIGHTWSPELAPLLAEMHQDFIEQGYTLTTAANFISR